MVEGAGEDKKDIDGGESGDATAKLNHKYDNRTMPIVVLHPVYIHSSVCVIGS